MSQSRRDSRVGLWGMGSMYSKVLALEEAVRRNLGLRMLGEIQWMILRFSDDLCSFLLQKTVGSARNTCGVGLAVEFGTSGTDSPVCWETAKKTSQRNKMSGSEVKLRTPKK